MSNLAERLSMARQSRSEPQEAPPGTRPGPAAARAPRREADPFSGVKGRVHQSLLESLGPRLYDPHLAESELAAQVRATLQQVSDAEQTPLSQSDRTKIAQDVSDDAEAARDRADKARDAQQRGWDPWRPGAARSRRAPRGGTRPRPARARPS